MKPFRRVLLFVLGIGLIIFGIRLSGGFDPPSFRIISELWRGEGVFGEKVAEPTRVLEKPLKFAVMSDIHSDWVNFKKALGKAKEDFGPASVETSARQGFVIITGDLTTVGEKKELIEAKKVLDESGLRYYVIPGNHDLWLSNKTNGNLFEQVFGKDFQSFKEGEVKFILINNGGYKGVGEVGTEWLKAEVEECPKIICLVFMHMPLNHPNSKHVMGEDNTKVTKEADEIRKLLVDSKVKELFAGHLHYYNVYDLGGLKTTLVGAVNEERNVESLKFTEVVLQNGYISREEVFIPN